MTAPAERRFIVFDRGVVRDDIILAAFRNSLRASINPETGITFTEDEVQRATQPGSRFYIEADAIDLLTQASQSRALWSANQVDPRTANTDFLINYHGRLWLGENSVLDATGGSAEDGVSAEASPGAVWPGSTTIPDPAAAVATDPNGYRYQVLQTVVTPANGTAILTMQGVDTGVVTNLIVGTVLTWSANQPISAEPEASVIVQFSGGFDDETNSEYEDRIETRIRYRPAGGNNAHFVAWSREASVAVENGFVYATAFHAGSVLVAITQKRGSTTGPDARIPSAGTITSVTNFLVPPDSAVVPQRVYVVVTGVTTQESDLVIRISMATGAASAWFDSDPWPDYSVSYPDVQITNKVSQVQFDVETDALLPGGAASLSGDDAPNMMLWNKAISRWERLDVDSVSKAGTTVTVNLNGTGPSFTIAVGDRLSPYTDQLTVIAESLEDYFDTLGPQEVVDLTTDERAARALRYPRPEQQSPIRAGQALISPLLEALGGVSPDAELTAISKSEPDLPGDMIDGPNILSLGDVNIYTL